MNYAGVHGAGTHGSAADKALGGASYRRRALQALAVVTLGDAVGEPLRSRVAVRVDAGSVDIGRGGEDRLVELFAEISEQSFDAVRGAVVAFDFPCPAAVGGVEGQGLFHLTSGP
jgi:hypothetical protein